jgi:hypothetical protein
VRAILDRLGDPTTLAAEARFPEDNATTPPTGAAPAAPPGKHRLGPLGWTLIAVALTLLICLVAGLVGLVASTTGAGTGGPAPVPVYPTHR